MDDTEATGLEQIRAFLAGSVGVRFAGQKREEVYGWSKVRWCCINTGASDNGSEFINYNVARLLGKLLIEQTKSRAHHCGDNGLVECKNGAIIRRHIGYGHIDARHAAAVDGFHRQYLNPYVNFHRPCAVPKIITEANGKRRRIYLRWATPLELLREAPNWEQLLQPGVTAAELERLAQQQSDTEAALEMQSAKRPLLARIGKRSA